MLGTWVAITVHSDKACMPIQALVSLGLIQFRSLHHRLLGHASPCMCSDKFHVIFSAFRFSFNFRFEWSLEIKSYVSELGIFIWKEKKRQRKEGRRVTWTWQLRVTVTWLTTLIGFLNKEDWTSTCKSRMQLLAGFSSERAWNMISSGLSSPLNGRIILLHQTSAAPSLSVYLILWWKVFFN